MDKEIWERVKGRVFLLLLVRAAAAMEVMAVTERGWTRRAEVGAHMIYRRVLLNQGVVAVVSV